MLSLLVATVSGTILVSGPAHADPTDTQFLNSLDNDGIWYTNIQGIINYAHGVCTELDIGVPHLRVIDNVLSDYPAMGTWDNAMHFVVDAYMTYCPWHQLPPAPPASVSDIGYR
jgi:hypothetical protein